MLVIRRRAGESLLIGADIAIEILEVESGQVKIGVRAPRQVPVLRREIAVAAAANEQAHQVLPERVRQLRDQLISTNRSNSPGPDR